MVISMFHLLCQRNLSSPLPQIYYNLGWSKEYYSDPRYYTSGTFNKIYSISYAWVYSYLHVVTLSLCFHAQVLLKFNVPEEQIAKQTRWHRIAMIRKLSSEQAASGVKVDPTTISKYARGQRMSFLQLQQQTREKCQEIWDRQFQSLSAIDGEDIESDTEAHSDLDSFAGDLENLLDAEEECEEGEEEEIEGVKGLKMRRRPSQVQAEEEIEDEAAEAAELCRMLMDGMFCLDYFVCSYSVVLEANNWLPKFVPLDDMLSIVPAYFV